MLTWFSLYDQQCYAAVSLVFKYLGLTLHKSATLKLVTAAEVHLLRRCISSDPQKSLQRQRGALIFP